MSALGRIFTAVSTALEFNTATLSGAIDIIVIEDDSGRRKCTPFHVRFGKLQLLRSRGMPVLIELNGARTNLKMYLGAAGEAYFYHPKQSNSNESSAENITHSANSSAHISDPLQTQLLDSLISQPAIASTDPTDQDKANNSIPTHKNDEAEQAHSPTREPATDAFACVSDSEVELTRNERDGTQAVAEQPRSPPLFQPQRKWSSTILLTSSLDASDITATLKSNEHDPRLSSQSQDTKLDIEYKKVSNGEYSSSSQLPSNATSQQQPIRSQLQSKDELPSNSSKRVLIEDPLTVSTSISDVVGEEERKLECRSIDGYEADDDPIELLQERVVSALAKSSAKQNHRVNGISKTDQKFSEVGSSDDSFDFEQTERRHLPDHNIENNNARIESDVLEMSLCGELLKPGMDEEQIMALFRRHRISCEEFSKRPSLLYDPSILFRIDDRLVEFRVAAPFLFSILAFNERLDIDTLADVTAPEEQRQQKEALIEPSKSPPTPSRRFSRWLFGLSSPAVQGEPLLQEEDLDELETNKDEETNTNIEANEAKSNDKEEIKQEESSNVPLSDIRTAESSQEEQENKPSDESVESRNQNILDSPETENQDHKPEKEDKIVEPILPDSEELRQEELVSLSELDPEALSLFPTEEELMELDLKPGPNTIRFVVQSTGVELDCRIFLWGAHSKIVISDVDGTITRSDVLGHLLPAVGRDWSQVGVAGLYSEIEKNGYKLLYLTARPIGQASQTRAFLHSVVQVNSHLPNGPVLMSPNRLVESFTREVIRRNPEVFKIAALREVRSLYPMDYNPFHAGFGNRETDVISYKAVGLISQRIFVVNPKGELVVTKARYESVASYSTLQDLVESVFPDISGQDRLERVQALTESATFNDWNYWRGSLPTVDVEALLEEGN